MRARKHTKAGLPPGSIIYVGPPRDAPVTIDRLTYTENTYTEERVTPERCIPGKGVTWIQVNGIHDTAIIEQLGRQFSLHPLLLEDVAHAEQRPKIEEFDDKLFVVLRVLDYEGKHLSSQQLSLVLGKNLVLSFQEEESGLFQALRAHIKNPKSRFRTRKADYLLYAIIDLIIDHYFVCLEALGETVERLNEELLHDPSPEKVKDIQHLKHIAITLRRSVWPLREVIGGLERNDSGLITKGTHIYLRDVYDHTIQVIDSIETLRDNLSGMLDLYLSSVSNRMNEIMQVLTIISTIFIPLTFITGVYGMNFRNMPELSWQYGYFGALAVMLIIAITMVLYFKKKKWL
ncbi:magnesium and cobalt transport protein CorA [Candidatus Woesearchaeota archaeon]|nr:MAG: magnesium and cobalt transport protein CorA [Candidatus Woesearchaeota archaeon]